VGSRKEQGKKCKKEKGTHEEKSKRRHKNQQREIKPVMNTTILEPPCSLYLSLCCGQQQGSR
jgi:hypothetical protein